MKAISIHFKVRLGYDALETYRILWDLTRVPLMTLDNDVYHQEFKRKGV